MKVRGGDGVEPSSGSPPSIAPSIGAPVPHGFQFASRTILLFYKTRVCFRRLGRCLCKDIDYPFLYPGAFVQRPRGLDSLRFYVSVTLWCFTCISRLETAVEDPVRFTHRPAALVRRTFYPILLVWWRVPSTHVGNTHREWFRRGGIWMPPTSRHVVDRLDDTPRARFNFQS